MSLTINDIANMAGVSRGTVSRVLNNHPYVEDKTRQKILQIIEETNFVVNDNAKGLRKRKTNLIGYLAAQQMHPWQTEFIRGILEELKTSNYHLLMYATNYRPDDPDNIKEFERTLKNGLADGVIIILPADLPDYFQKLYSSSLPILVTDDTGFVDDKDIPCVRTDNYQGAVEATRHLIGLGHQRIAFINGPLHLRFSQDRLAGYKAALTEAGLQFDPALVCAQDFLEEDSGYECMNNLLNSGKDNANPPFSGVFAATDVLAIGAMRALKERGLRVPEDISIIGFDDQPAASYTTPGLTTIHQPMFELGQLAARMLIERIEGKEVLPRKVELPTTLVIRSSTKAR